MDARGIPIRLLVLTILLLAACAPTPPPAAEDPTDQCEAPEAVPPHLRCAYTDVDAAVEGWAVAVARAEDEGPTTPRPTPEPQVPTAFGVTLDVADANRGSQLLEADHRQLVAIMLDRLDPSLTTVTVDIGFPLLLPRWVPDAAAYLDFYRWLADAASQRDLRLGIRMPMLWDRSELSRFRLGLTADGRADLNAVAAGYLAMAQAIVTGLKPHSLTLVPDPLLFEGRWTGDEVPTPASASPALRLLAGTARGLAPGSTKVGAGMSMRADAEHRRAWSSTLCTNTSLQYVDTTITGTSPQEVPALRQTAEEAEQCGRSLAMSAPWLVKATSGSEIGPVALAEARGRDTLSCFEALDIRFHELLVTAARDVGAEWLTPGHSDLYFAYLDCESYAQEPVRSLVLDDLPQEAADAAINAEVSALGAAYPAMLDR